MASAAEEINVATHTHLRRRPLAWGTPIWDDPLCSHIASDLPDPWYASPRNALDQLDSSPESVKVSLRGLGAEGVRAAVRVAGGQGNVEGIRVALRAAVAGCALRFDGGIVEEYVGEVGAMMPVPPLDVTVDAECVAAWQEWHRRGCVDREAPDVLLLSVGRRLPLSSNVGNCPLVLALNVGGEVVVSAPFIVHARQAKRNQVPRVRKDRKAVEVSDRDRALLQVVYATCGGVRVGAGVGAGAGPGPSEAAIPRPQAKASGGGDGPLKKRLRQEEVKAQAKTGRVIDAGPAATAATYTVFVPGVPPVASVGGHSDSPAAYAFTELDPFFTGEEGFSWVAGGGQPHGWWRTST
jgi:hypothetical protein